MTDSALLPSTDEVYGDLVVVRKKGVNQLGRVNVPALQKCAELVQSLATPKDIETLLNISVDRMAIEDERAAIKCLLGLASDLRRTSLTVRRDQAARAVHLSSEGFRRHMEATLIRKFAIAVLDECKERITKEEERRAEEPEPEPEETANAEEEAQTPEEKRWRRFYQRMEERAKKLNDSETLKAVGMGGGAILAVIALIGWLSQCQSPHDTAQQSPPAVSPQPYPGGPPPPSNPSATNEIYIAGNRFVNQGFEDADEAYCGKSPASNRADAYLCAIPPQLGPTRAKLDPCFGVDDKSVVCGNLSEPQKFWRFHARGVQAADSNPVPPGTHTWPFQVVLDDGTVCRSFTGVMVREGDSYLMDLRNQPSLEHQPGYFCGNQFGSTLATGWRVGSDGLLDAVRWLEPPDTKKSQLSSLTVEGGSWYAMYSPQEGTPYKRTHIAMAAF
ncbi:hypothetical protein [Nocardia nova]|uniref:hypothetical protein n=1 Tax=Nocardia nova TaxID=37330 RepID=UPI0011B008C3|nr:hypothetical protein [Nocardia nova]